jgi:hypothetical protein
MGKARNIILSTLFFFSSGNTFLLAADLSESWESYQKGVLEEQAHFSGWCPSAKAQHIMNILLANESKICVELGVYGGSSFYPIAATLAFKEEGIAYAIDPWTHEDCLVGYDEGDEKIRNFWGKTDLEGIMNKFIEKMHLLGLDSTYVLMRMTSARAYSQFDDASIDFIHIDGNHSEQSAVFDVKHWLPKVKSGGIVCFDDAWWSSTQPAIKILLTECDIMPESSPKWQYIFLRKR